MVKRIFAGLGVLACLALLVLWRFGFDGGAPVARAQVAPPGIPVTAGVVIAQDVPPDRPTPL